MSDYQARYDDEVDLFELIETLWHDRLLIAAATIFSAIIGFAYVMVTPPQYRVSTSYSFEIPSIEAYELCGNSSCIDGEMIQLLAGVTTGRWSVSARDKRLGFAIEAPEDRSVYLSQLETYREALTNEVYEKALLELELIRSETSEQFLSTERVATNMLRANRIVRRIENGEKTVRFGDITIVQEQPRISLIVALSVILGGMLSCGFVLIRNALKKRRNPDDSE